MDLEEIKNKLRDPQQYGQATPEEAKFAFESGYAGGPKTQEYYQQLGLLNPPVNEQPTNTALTPAEQYAMAQADAKAKAKAGSTFNSSQGITPQTELPEQQAEQPQTTTKAPNFSKFKDTDIFDRGLKAWSPIAPNMVSGGDRSGEASGYRAGAAIQDKAAADFSKVAQWNKQRATDNTLADKVAAAQASGQWRQNANALGAEGGASVVASQNQAVTPDIMAQKQFQTQQMQNAERSMAETNARKVAAQNNRTKADMTDYNTRYNESKDTYAYNLATANDQSKNSVESKSVEKAENTTAPETTTPNDTEKSDGKATSNTEETAEPQVVAETNKQSNATETATQEVSEQQQLQELADEINGIYNVVASLKGDSQQNVQTLKDQKARYDEIKPQYDALAAKSKNPPPTISKPDFGMFDEKFSKVPDTVLAGVSQRF